MGRAYIMINKGLETTQHLMLLQVSCVSVSAYRQNNGATIIFQLSTN